MIDTASRRPGDTFRPPQPWQLAGGRDPRWGQVGDVYRAHSVDQCRFCGDSYYNQGRDCPRASCLACGTPQCDNSGTCLVCLAGFVGSPPWNVTECGYSRCDGRPVAKAPRVRVVCLAHLSKPAVSLSGVRIPLADTIAAALLQRDLGGLHWQKLTWFGPELRYAVRRWRDGEPQAWTTGQDPAGFETAGQADREAASWNDPRSFDRPWHAERVTLSPQTWEQIRAWESQAKTARLR